MIDFEQFWQMLSDYIDEELEKDIYEEFDDMICEVAECEHLFNTLQKTLHICHEMEMVEVPEEVHVELHRVLQVEMGVMQEEPEEEDNFFEETDDEDL